VIFIAYPEKHKIIEEIRAEIAASVLAATIAAPGAHWIQNL